MCAACGPSARCDAASVRSMGPPVTLTMAVPSPLEPLLTTGVRLALAAPSATAGPAATKGRATRGSARTSGARTGGRMGAPRARGPPCGGGGGGAGGGEGQGDEGECEDERGEDRATHVSSLSEWPPVRRRCREVLR